MAANDVKVTLTADDQATEIVRRLAAAVKQLAAQQGVSNNSLRDSKRAADGASSSFSSFQRAIAGVAAALGAVRVVEFVRDTIEATDQIGKLAQKTGASTEALSILAVAASTADLSQQELGDGLKFLSRSLSELNAGVPKSVEAFGALGLSAKELKGLSLDQVLVKLANAQDNFADGAGKAAALMQIFGRNGTALIPLLHDLANGGFDEAAQKAKDLGLVIGTDAANSARDFDDAVATLKKSLEGVVVSMAPLVKQIADLTTNVATFVAEHQKIVAVAGALSLLAGAIGAVTAAMAAFKAVGAVAMLARFAAFLVSGPIGIAIGVLLTLATAFGIVKAHIDSVNAAAEAAAKKNLDQLIGDVGLKDTKKPQVNLQDDAQRKALIDAQIAARKQGLKDELDAQSSGLKRIEAADQAAFAEGLTSLREFFAQRIGIVRQGVANQIAELQAQKSALSAAPLAENTEAEKIKRTTELKALDAQIARVKIDGETQVIALLEQQRSQSQSLFDSVQSFAQQIKTATGNAIGAQLLQIDAAAEHYRQVLAQVHGLTVEEVNAQVNAFKTLLVDRAAFEEKQRQGERVMTDLELRRQAIQAQADQGLTSQRDAQMQIAAIEQSRLPVLNEIAERMKAFADRTNDPALKQSAEQFAASFATIGKVADEASIKLANLSDSLFSNAQSELSNFLGSTITQVNSLSDALVKLAAAVVGSFQRVLGDLIASEAIKQLRSLFGGGSAQQQANQLGLLAQGVGVFQGVFTNGAAATQTAAAALGNAGLVVLGAAHAMSAAAAQLAIAAAAAANAQFAASALSGSFLAGFASGGPIAGPGTATSDSILARLSAGEYVIRAAAVRKFGVGLFDMLNGLKMPTLIRPTIAGVPAFASGGFVASGGSSATVSGGVDITVSAAPGSAIQDIKTRGGVKALRDVIGGNPQMFKAALGIP